jgi:dTDP-4-amino-4,6-dideoxygalactose transaminase
MMNVPFLDLKQQYVQIKHQVNISLEKLLARCDFILGEDVLEFERKFAKYNGARFALGVNSGTDALFFSLLSLGISSGDEVIVPVFTYIASAFAVTYTGAKPVFVDINERTYNIDPEKIEKAITKKTRAIMPVHLYGQSADMDAITKISKKHGLKIVEDAAQAHGTLYRGKKAGGLGDVGAFSFYPTKNLGAFGDAGMIVTNNEILYEKLKKLRDYGRKSRYEHTSLGYNSRLDSIQAVFLIEKLKMLDQWNQMRIDAAYYYKKLLKGIDGIILPDEERYGKHVYHIFAVRLKNRDEIQEGLKKSGIASMVHYPVPLHLQGVYKNLRYKKGDFPIAEKICGQVLCLPIYPHIKREQIEYVCKKLKGLVING